MFAKRRTGSAGLSVAVVGAGFAGIAAAVKLKQAGFENFTVFERSAGAGGTWFDNTYPGCGVDTLNDLYSFSFLRYDWTRTYAQRAEMHHAEALLEAADEAVRHDELWRTYGAERTIANVLARLGHEARGSLKSAHCPQSTEPKGMRSYDKTFQKIGNRDKLTP